MSFKSSNQRKFLFAKDKEKAQQTGISSQKSSPNSFSTSHPSEITVPFKAFKLGAPSASKFNPPVSKSISPTSNPGIIPSLPSLPKFAKTKKLFKKV